MLLNVFPTLLEVAIVLQGLGVLQPQERCAVAGSPSRVVTPVGNSQSILFPPPPHSPVISTTSLHMPEIQRQGLFPLHPSMRMNHGAP